jgi:hypothetical protein
MSNRLTTLNPREWRTDLLVAIEWLVLAWVTEAEEWENRIVTLPI